MSISDLILSRATGNSNSQDNFASAMHNTAESTENVSSSETPLIAAEVETEAAEVHLCPVISIFCCSQWLLIYI